MVRWAFGDIDLLSAGISDCNKQTIDIHCPLFSESPTNINLLPLNFSHISFTFHLFYTRNMWRFRLWSLTKITYFVINEYRACLVIENMFCFMLNHSYLKEKKKKKRGQFWESDVWSYLYASEIGKMSYIIGSFG
jgi:hypothetical protein